MAQQLTINIEDTGILSSLMRILSSIKGISLQPLADAQRESTATSRATVPHFPHIPQNRALSPEVMEMVAGQLPADFDYEKERAAMWEELAK